MYLFVFKICTESVQFEHIGEISTVNHLEHNQNCFPILVYFPLLLTSRQQVHDHMEQYFAQAQQVVATPKAQLELCLLITHCFEDHFQAEAVQEGTRLLCYSSQMIAACLDDIRSDGKMLTV